MRSLNILYIDDFFNYLKFEKRCSQNTIDAYLNDIKQFFNITQTNNITRTDILQYLNYLKEQLYAASSINRKLVAIQCYIHFLINEKKYNISIKNIIHRPQATLKLPNSISENEINILFKSIDTKNSPTPYQDKAILELLYACGLRVSECCNIKLQQLDFESNIIRIFGKGQKERIVPIGTHAKKAILNYINYARHTKPRKCTYLFINKKNKPLSRQYVYLLVKKYVQHAGIRPDISPHSFRHSFATHLLDHDAELLEVKHLLGHSNITSTEIYTHISKSKLLKVIKNHPRY